MGKGKGKQRPGTVQPEILKTGVWRKLNFIRKTCPCNEYPHFHIVKLGYAVLMKLGLKYRVLLLIIFYINHDIGLTLTCFMARSILVT